MEQNENSSKKKVDNIKCLNNKQANKQASKQTHPRVGGKNEIVLARKPQK